MRGCLQEVTCGCSDKRNYKSSKKTRHKLKAICRNRIRHLKAIVYSGFQKSLPNYFFYDSVATPLFHWQPKDQHTSANLFVYFCYTISNFCLIIFVVAVVWLGM